MDILNDILKLIYELRALLIILALVSAVIAWWEPIRYQLFKLWVWFPIIGIVARNSRANHYLVPFNENTKWFRSQSALSARFYSYYDKLNKDAAFYDKCADYLNKVDERGRKPKSLGLWLGTIVLVLLEAYIFSLVLVPFMDDKVSSNQAVLAAWGLAIMIAVILVAVTHMMGFELHKNTLLNKARAWHASAKLKGDAKHLQPNSKIDLDHTYGDDAEPQYIQLINRIPHNAKVGPSWVMSIIAVLLIAIFAFGAYWIRSLTINELETVMVNGPSFETQMDSADGDISLFALPEEAMNDAHKADSLAQGEAMSARIQAYKTTFLILSVIFVGIQIVGILVGFLRSFAGKQSRDASKYIGAFNSANEFEQHYETKRVQVAADAQAALQSLTQKIELRHELVGSSDSITSSITFDDYVAETIRKRNLGRQEKKNSAPSQPKVMDAVPEAIAVPASEFSPKVDLPVEDNSAKKDVAGISDELLLTLGDLTQYDDTALAELASAIGCSVQQLKLKQTLMKISAAKNGVVS